MTDDSRYIPDGYTWQISDSRFRFDIVTSSRMFTKYSHFANTHMLLHNLCDQTLTDLADPQLPQPLLLTTPQYIHVIQKSPIWLHLRKQAHGTASSVGKYIRSVNSYPTHQQLLDAWKDKISDKPFHADTATTGHMRWGVGYEDPALIHFAVQNMLAVTQVGTIQLPLEYIIQLAKDTGTLPDEALLFPKSTFPAHLLISPDGMVHKPGTTQYIGMLEIKCISPFHHIPFPDNTLGWVEDMQSRQWHHPAQIPFVYMVQMGLQAISGLYRFHMTPQDTMWFIRWSPHGFSQFHVTFDKLIPFGIIAAIIYFKLLHHHHTHHQIPLPYTPDIMALHTQLQAAYQHILGHMHHTYHDHHTLYPEFHTYRLITEHHRFTM
jgi:YqaJ-like viral recombinase domain